MKTETGSSRIERPTWKFPAVSHSHPIEMCERASGLFSQQPDEGDERADEGDEDRGGREVARAAAGEALAEEGDR